MNLKSVVSSNKLVTTFKTTKTATAGKIKTYHHHLQVSNLAVHVYPALQLMQAILWQLSFEDEILVDDKLTTKTMILTSLKNVCIHSTSLTRKEFKNHKYCIAEKN